MADDIDLGEDDGWVKVRGEGNSEVRLDLFRTHNQLVDYHAKNKSKTEEDYASGLIDLMIGLGLPPCSHRMAIRFVTSIRERVDDIKKKPLTMPAVPVSTASTPSP